MTNTPPTGTVPDPTTVQNSTDSINQNSDAQKRNRDEAKLNTDQMQAYASQVDKSTSLLNLFSGGLKAASTLFGSLEDTVSSYMRNVDKSTDLSIAKMTAFGAAVSTVFGTTKSTFGGASFTGLNTFSGQLDSMIEPIKNNKTALGLLADQFGVILPDNVKKSSDSMVNFIKGAVGNLTESADNALKLEDVYIRAAAATGRLGDVHEQAGTSLEHMNRLVRDQRSAINETIIATNLSKDTVEAYYQQLSQLPIAMKGQVDSSTSARGATDQLARTIQLARGTGRDFKDVVDDMKLAINDYNASIPEAMKFTAQISEVSQKYNIQIDDVRKSLTSTAGAFKMFGNEAEGAANILNQYVGQLKATGLSGQVASDIVTNMTNQIGNLSIAQKSFLSSQGGGPGGLVGAYSIDMMLRKGQIDKVFEMTKSQLTRMMGGNLVTTQEAANSPQAAAQMTKQIMMLRQGPLGQFARTDAEAERIIDALKTGRGADIKPLLDGQKAVDQATKLGNDYAKQSATGISKIVSIMEQARGEASSANLETIQAGFTAGAGTEFENQNLMVVQARQSELSDAMEEGTRKVGAPANAERVIENAAKAGRAAPNELMSVIEGVGSRTAGEGSNERAEAFAKQYAEAHARETSGAHVGAAAASVASRRAAETSALGLPISPGGAPNPGAGRASPLGEIIVKVEGYCIHCKEKIEGAEHREAVSVGSRIPQ